MGFDIILLFCQAFLDFLQINHLTGLFLFVAQGFLYLFLELFHLGLMPADSFLL